MAGDKISDRDDDDDGGGGEEAAIERQLEQHLEEQKESLAAVNEALAFDPSNPELLAVHKELLLALKDAEEGLFHLKQSRLLKETETILLKQESESRVPDVKAEPLDPREIEPEPLELENYSVGSNCRFRHTDGRWYNGHIVGLEGASSARISFLTPTSESMLMCEFFLHQGCWFGSKCRLSHGFSVPVSSLKQYIPAIWQQSLVGSTIWAVSGDHSDIWRKAKLESWDDELQLAQVVFQDDGSSAKLGSSALSLSEYALLSGSSDDDDDDDDGLSSESSDSAEGGDDPECDGGPQGLGFLEATAVQSGVQTETPVFAKWEHHTRGIASKMMASMGYQEGMGLGVSGQGITVPISETIPPPSRSLEDALAANKTEKGTAQRKKRSRGGRRKRDKRHAEAARAAKAGEERGPDVFSFINNQLVGQGAANTPSKLKMGPGKVETHARREDRRSLVAYDDEVRELRSRVERLEEMVSRNRKDKAVYEAASRKLEETRKTLADAEASHASASDAVASKEKEKKWLKF